MENEEMNATSLIKIKDHPVTVPLVWLAVIFVAGWTGKPMLRAAIAEEFYTRVEAQTDFHALTERLDSIEVAQGRMAKAMNDDIDSRRVEGAFNLLRSLKSELSEHNEISHDSIGWLNRNQSLEDQVMLAKEYKSCVRSGENGCEIIKRQIFR